MKRFRGKQRPIYCEGNPTHAVRLGSTWICARCSSVLLTIYVAAGRTERDLVHHS